jgi:hypothetical protein
MTGGFSQSPMIRHSPRRQTPVIFLKNLPLLPNFSE